MICTKNTCVDIPTDIFVERPPNSDIASGKNHDILTLPLVCVDRVEVRNLCFDDINLPSYTIKNTNSKYNADTTAEMQLNNKDAKNQVALIEPTEVVDDFEVANGTLGEKEYVHLDVTENQGKVVSESHSNTN
ncbi:hypothetical protein JTB14_008877 [Gonioctena quinquepunctata]|nr:hypothetical protein JTB14_008877 [Gonioctena quinquepunctata]